MSQDVREKPPEDAPGHGEQPKSPGERRCVECDVKLSQYNPGPHCWQHTMGWPWRGPSAKPRV